MKIGLVYTSTTPELIELVEKEVRSQLGDVELLSYQDASILTETRDAGAVTAFAGARLVALYLQAVQDKVDAILNICSSVGEVADASQDIARYLGVPIVRIDEEMCRDAVRLAAKQDLRIGVLATLPTTLNPTKNTIYRVAREMGKSVTLVDGLIDAFGANQATFRDLILKKADEIASQVDVILFCQGSMAYCEELVRENCKKEVLSSPRYGAVALKNALINKGIM